MIATTIAAIGRNQVTSTRACCGSASAQPVERTNSELIAPSNRLDGACLGTGRQISWGRSDAANDWRSSLG